MAAQSKGDKVAPAASQPAGAAAKPQLRGGASALSETHGDWTVNCTNKICSLSHQQFNKQSGTEAVGDRIDDQDRPGRIGTLALPFGLALANGIALEIDDKKLEGSLQFNTCQAVGCLVSVAFDSSHRGRPDRRLVYGADGSARLEVDPKGDGHFVAVK